MANTAVRGNLDILDSIKINQNYSSKSKGNLLQEKKEKIKFLKNFISKYEKRKFQKKSKNKRLPLT